MEGKMGNRRAGALAALLILLLLAACSSPAQTSKSSFQGTITLWAGRTLAGHPVPLEEGWLGERTATFAAAHPGVKIEIRTFNTGEEMELALLANSEAKPDLYLGRPLARLETAALPLRPELVNDQHEKALSPYRRGEVLSGLPLLLDLQVLAVNDRAFAARSVPLPPDGRISPTYLAEQLPKLAGNGLFALGFSVSPGYHQWWPLAGGLLTADGGIAPGAEAALGRLAEWRRKGYIYPEIATLTTDQSYRLFAADPPVLAMLPVPVWTIPLLRGEPYKAAFTVAGFPDGESAGYAYGLIAPGPGSPAKLPALAELVEFLAAPDQQVRLARNCGLMPARRSAPNPFEGDPQLSRAFQLTSSFRPLPAEPAWDAAQPPVARELLLTLYGGKAPAAALETVRLQFKTATTPAK